MANPGGSIFFSGDFDDPWVAAIGLGLPPGAVQFPCAGPLTDSWLDAARTARAVILHRAILTDSDADRVRALRDLEGPTPRMLLCVGPYARYHQLERWNALVDAVLPEATASETLERRLFGDESLGPPRSEARPDVAIVSTLGEMRRSLGDLCAAAGFPVTEARDWSEAPAGLLSVWDVPLLEDGWPLDLAEQTRARSVVVLLGFADRATVALARSQGAAACLDSTCDLPDLPFVLDRVGSLDYRSKGIRLVAGETAHTLPAEPRSLRRGIRNPNRAGVFPFAPLAEPTRRS